MARYWRISGIQTASNTLDVQALALSDGSTDYAAPLLSGALGAGFVIDWDLGADLPVDRLKLTAGAQADWPTSLLLMQSVDGQSWSAGLSFNTMAWPGSGVQQLFSFDAYAPFVSLLLNGNAANASTTFADSSQTPKTVTVVGNAQISTAQSKFGGASMYFDGTGDYLTAPKGTDLQFGSGNFTVELWYNQTSRVKAYPCLWSNYNSYSAGAIGLYAGHGSGLTTKFQVAVSGKTFPAIQSTQDIVTNSWQHLAVVRQGDTLTLYVDGVAAGSTSIAGITLDGVGPSFHVGLTGDVLTDSTINGYIDDLRITKGVARYTANFTPPTAEFFAITGLTPPAIATPLDTPAIVLRDPGHQDGTLHLRAPDPSAIDMLDGGSHKVVGTVAEKASPTNLPLVRRVMLIDEQSHRVVRETWSDAAGNYTFTSVRSATTYTVLAYDHTETYGTVVADRVLPEAMP